MTQEEERTRLELEDNRKKERKLQEQRLVRLDLDSFNKARIQQRQKEIQETLESDMKILSEFIKAGKAEREANARRRVQLRNEMSLYRENLERAKVVEVQRQKDIEQWYSKEQDRVFLF